MKLFFYILLLFHLVSQSAYADCQRIISQSPYISLQLEYLGLKECIVGASRYETRLTVADTGGIIDPDEASIAALKPDLWITSVWTPEARFSKIAQHTKQSLRLASFQGMAQISDNLIAIARSAKSSKAQRNLLKKAQAFAPAWKQSIQRVNGEGKKVLLLSSCTGQPYSFGHKTWLAELFTAAGFTLVDSTQGVRHLSQDRTPEETLALIDALKPEIIFVFTKQVADACSLIELPQTAKLLVLDGDKFLHPAPVLLEGIDQLIAMQPIWQQQASMQNSTTKLLGD